MISQTSAVALCCRYSCTTVVQLQSCTEISMILPDCACAMVPTWSKPALSLGCRCFRSVTAILHSRIPCKAFRFVNRPAPDSILLHSVEAAYSVKQVCSITALTRLVCMYVCMYVCMHVCMYV